MPNLRIVIVAKRLEVDRYQIHLRTAAGGDVLFFSRRSNRLSSAKRDAELLFGPLDWQPAPEALQQSEPGANQVAYLNLLPIE